MKTYAIALAAGLGMVAFAPSHADARSSYSFGFSTGGPMIAPAPVFVAPPPPPPVFVRPVYPVYGGPVWRPGPSFSFSYTGH